MEEGPEAQSGVCGAIEEQRQQIDLLALPYVMLSELAHLPECAGIYFAIEESGELLYVGQSTNIRARWRSHHVKNSLCDPSDLAGARRIRLALLAVDDAQDLLEIEDRFILQFKPRLNRPHISEENKLRASPTLAKSLAANACYGTTMTATVFAKRMGVDYSTVMRWLKRNLVPGAKLQESPDRGKWWEIPESALQMERPKWGGPKGGTKRGAVNVTKGRKKQSPNAQEE